MVEFNPYAHLQFFKDGSGYDKVWAIGDVHGCLNEYITLIEKIKERSKNPLIIQLGDLIDRGPYFFELFIADKICNVDIINILGNHEYSFIRERQGIIHCRSKSRHESHGRFDALPGKDKEIVWDKITGFLPYLKVYLSDRDNYYNDGGVLLSHAPATSNGMSAGIRNYLSYSGDVDQIPTLDYINLNIHGHQHWSYTPMEQVEVGKTRYNIDGGCVYGGELIALELSSFEYLSVKGKAYVNENK